jgi:methylglutaconyl-CoA hydratase
MADELVHYDLAGGVATITLDSPHNRNALSRVTWCCAATT